MSEPVLTGAVRKSLDYFIIIIITPVCLFIYIISVVYIYA